MRSRVRDTSAPGLPSDDRTMNPCEMKLSNDLHALQEKVNALRELMDERDRRYSERAEGDQRALVAALAAVKEQTASSFSASKEAIVKAETNQTTYNATHNDLTRKMDAQYQTMLPRTEAEIKNKALDDRLNNLKSSVDRLEAGGKGMEKLWGWIFGVVMAAIAVVGIYLRK